MKRLNWIISILLIAVLFCNCSGSQKDSDNNESEKHYSQEDKKPDKKKKSLSPRRDVMATISSTPVHINYSSPGVRGRTIWGGLVAYGEVWVTGAHKATSIEFSGNVRVGGKDVEKGKYALFTIPGEKEWTIIINKNFDQHLADNYDENLDIVRVKAIPESLGEIQESLTYKVEETSKNKGKVSILWGNIMVSFDVETI